MDISFALLHPIGQGHPKAQARLQEMQKGGSGKKQRERLSRSNKAKDDADCVIM